MDKGHSITWFLHMHKAAGTSLCNLAKLHNESFWFHSDHRAHIDLIYNRTNDKNSPNEKLIHGNSKDTLEFLQQLIQEKVTFVSTEHWFPSHFTVDILQSQLNIKFITALRHPRSPGGSG